MGDALAELVASSAAFPARKQRREIGEPVALADAEVAVQRPAGTRPERARPRTPALPDYEGDGLVEVEVGELDVRQLGRPHPVSRNSRMMAVSRQASNSSRHRSPEALVAAPG